MVLNSRQDEFINDCEIEHATIRSPAALNCINTLCLNTLSNGKPPTEAHFYAGLLRLYTFCSFDDYTNRCDSMICHKTVHPNDKTTRANNSLRNFSDFIRSFCCEISFFCEENEENFEMNF